MVGNLLKLITFIKKVTKDANIFLIKNSKETIALIVHFSFVSKLLLCNLILLHKNGDIKKLSIFYVKIRIHVKTRGNMNLIKLIFVLFTIQLV